MDFEDVYRRYFGDVYRYLLRLSGSETVAEDVTSETFLRAMQALPRFRGDCDVRVWLCRIARNTYFSICRDPDNLPMEEPGEEQRDSAPSPEEETIRREVREEVGLKVKNIRYYKSQPWSFSETVLMGFFVDLDGDDETVTLDTEELATAEWFTREDAPPQPLNISLTSEMIWQFKNGKV